MDDISIGIACFIDSKQLKMHVRMRHFQTIVLNLTKMIYNQTNIYGHFLLLT